MLFIAAEGHQTCSLSLTIVMNLSIKTHSYSPLWCANKLGAACKKGMGRYSLLVVLHFPGYCCSHHPAHAAPSSAALRAAFLDVRCWSTLLLRLLQGSGHQSRGFCFRSVAASKNDKKRFKQNGEFSEKTAWEFTSFTLF